MAKHQTKHSKFLISEKKHPSCYITPLYVSRFNLFMWGKPQQGWAARPAAICLWLQLGKNTTTMATWAWQKAGESPAMIAHNNYWETKSPKSAVSRRRTQRFGKSVSVRCPTCNRSQATHSRSDQRHVWCHACQSSKPYIYIYVYIYLYSEYAVYSPSIIAKLLVHQLVPKSESCFASHTHENTLLSFRS